MPDRSNLTNIRASARDVAEMGDAAQAKLIEQASNIQSVALAANTAKTTADSAKTTADTAKSTADSAAAKANSAVQSVKVNGVTKTPTGGVVDLGTITGGAAAPNGTFVMLWDSAGKRWLEAGTVTRNATTGAITGGTAVTSADRTKLLGYAIIEAHAPTAASTDELGDLSWMPEYTQIVLGAGIV